MKPRIFISAVSSEFRTVRQSVANALSRLGYEPVVQEVFGTEPGDLRAMLRTKIDSCEGVLQIVGDAYGFEPSTIDEDFGRVSYTQYEFLYARKSGKKTWLLFAQDGCRRDASIDELDLPSPDNSADPKRDQSERRNLQAAYRRELERGGHLFYRAANDEQLQLAVFGLRDEFEKLRVRQERRARRAAALALFGIVLLIAVGGGVGWLVWNRDDPDDVADAVVRRLADPEMIRAQLRKAIVGSFERESTEARTLVDWRQREEAIAAAESRRDRRLGEIDAFLASIAATLAEGDASPEYRELLRIIEEQGVEEALAYVESKKLSLLDRARDEILQARLGARATLAPLLEGARLYAASGDYDAAIAAATDLEALDGEWPEALRAKLHALYDRALIATQRRGLSAGKPDVLAAYQVAGKLDDLEHGSAQSRRDLAASLYKMGNLHSREGDWEAASGYFEESVSAARQALARDPNDVESKRQLSIALEMFGEFLIQGGDLPKARELCEEDLGIWRGMVADAPASGDALRGLSVALEKFGTVSRQQGEFDAAASAYEEDLAIDRKLAKAAPADAEAKRDLSVSLNKVGLVRLDQGEFAEAQELFDESASLARELAQDDSENVRARRDLMASLNNLGYALSRQDLLDEAQAAFQEAADAARWTSVTDPASVEAKRDLSIALGQLGQVHYRRERYEDAIEVLVEGLNIRRELFDANSTSGQAMADLASALSVIGDVRLANGDLEAASAAYDESLSLATRRSDADRTSAPARYQVFVAHSKLAWLEERRSNLKAAIERFEEALIVLKSLEAERRLAPANQGAIEFTENALKDLRAREEVDSS